MWNSNRRQVLFFSTTKLFSIHRKLIKKLRYCQYLDKPKLQQDWTKCSRLSVPICRGTYVPATMLTVCPRLWRSMHTRTQITKFWLQWLEHKREVGKIATIFEEWRSSRQQKQHRDWWPTDSESMLQKADESMFFCEVRLASQNSSHPSNDWKKSVDHRKTDFLVVGAIS